MTRKQTRHISSVRVFKLGQEPNDDWRSTSTPEERLEMVASLSAWLHELRGIEVIAMDRQHLPVRVIHRA
jgi:hypothetical protein